MEITAINLMKFDVVISDKDGLWGSVKLSALSERAACALAREYIFEMVRIGDTSVHVPSLLTKATKLDN